MKQFILTVLMAVIHTAAMAQNCAPYTAQATLHANEVRANIQAGGGNFYSRDNQGEYYQVPYSSTDPSPNTIFAQSLWIGGFDAGGTLHLAAQTYRQSGDDYWSGTLDANGEVDSLTCGLWDKVWKVTKADIETAQDLFVSGQLNETNCPPALLSWVGANNPHSLAQNGFAAGSDFMAPFFDANGNGIYNPLEGDYPVLQTTPSIVVPDEMIWSLSNDNGNIHRQSSIDTSTISPALKIQFQKIDYAFASDITPIHRSTFTRYIIQNKSQVAYDSVKIGIWTQYNVGCATTDYLGTSIENNAIFAYSGENDDFWCNENMGFGVNMPVQTTQFLNKTLTNTMYHIINSPPLPPPSLITPTAANEFYAYLNSHWRDNTPLTYGEYGYTANGEPTNYAFSGNPNNLNEWSMESVNFTPFGRRILAAITESQLTPNEIVTLDFVNTFHREAGRDNLGNVDLMYEELPIVRDFYANRMAVATTNTSTQNLSVAISPNPTTQNAYLSIADTHLDLQLFLYDTRGKLVSAQTVSAGTQFVPITLPNHSGVYILRGFSANGKTFVKKIVRM